MRRGGRICRPILITIAPRLNLHDCAGGGRGAGRNPQAGGGRPRLLTTKLAPEDAERVAKGRADATRPLALSHAALHQARASPVRALTREPPPSCEHSPLRLSSLSLVAPLTPTLDRPRPQVLPQWPEDVRPPVGMPVRPAWSYSDTKQQLEDRERKSFDAWCRSLEARSSSPAAALPPPAREPLCRSGRAGRRACLPARWR